MLDPVVDEDVAAVLLACVFEGASPSSSASLQSPPATVESAALRFFNFLSFHDFNSSPVIIRGDAATVTPEERAREAAFRAAFSDNRDSMPALAVLLPYGAATAVTKSLSKQGRARWILLRIIFSIDFCVQVHGYKNGLSCVLKVRMGTHSVIS